MTYQPTSQQTWELDAAIQFIRELQPEAMEAGWCIMLGGGVLNNGYGPDLDLLAYPRTPISAREDLEEILPKGTWCNIGGVADLFTFFVDGKEVELIFQTRSA